jgi:hypothetical protein
MRVDLSDLEQRTLAALVEVGLPGGVAWPGVVQHFTEAERRQLPAILDRLRARLTPKALPEVTTG